MRTAAHTVLVMHAAVHKMSIMSTAAHTLHTAHVNCSQITVFQPFEISAKFSMIFMYFYILLV